MRKMLDIKMEFSLTEENPNISKKEFEGVISQLINFAETYPFAAMSWKLSFDERATTCGKEWIKDQLLNLLDRYEELERGARIIIAASVPWIVNN